MNKQQFDMDIQAADINSLRIGAANRIVQLLQKLRYSNNENSAKRWIWELCQNAKDVCNSTGKVKISINYDEMQRKVFFRHNHGGGKLAIWTWKLVEFNKVQVFFGFFGD